MTSVTDTTSADAEAAAVPEPASSAPVHDSAAAHVAGAARYIDDIAEPDGCLHACLATSTVAAGTLQGLDLLEAREVTGVVAILGPDAIPGDNDISPTGSNDEPLLAHERIEYHGQPLCIVIAETRNAARRAARHVKAEISSSKPILSIADALSQQARLVTEPLTLQRGEATRAIREAPNRITGQMTIGGQDHFYLEGHIALAIPGENGDMLVHSSTQHPSEVQHMVASVLRLASHQVTVQVRRMGGGFGGKETQSNLFAAAAALAARHTGRAVKLRVDRDDDMRITGKRHDFLVDYEVGFDDSGRILGLQSRYAARCGYSADLSGPVTDRALFHADNAYYYPDVMLRSQPLYTNTVSNTAFRGFGGPQGVLGAERLIDEIAHYLNRDPLDIRKLNFYGSGARSITPYHQTIKDNILLRLVEELEDTSNYRQRRADIIEFNNSHAWLRRGIALTPVKFGISFTATWYNQGGALVHVYTDGSILVNHGGTEMGQGLFTKVAQVVADVFGVDLQQVRASATATDKVPNTSATAASSGTDLNAMAAFDAATTIADRLADVMAAHCDCEPQQISFSDSRVTAPGHTLEFAEVVRMAYQQRVSLSSTGFYKTPDIHWDRNAGRGNPFYYFAYGAAVSEVVIDTLTGEYRVDRVDILHDVGQSLNPAIDRGQVEGGFIQGMGWVTSEELVWDQQGKLLTHAPSTYKIPLASDTPREFHVKLAQWSVNPARTIRRSKAVGEPPLMLCASVVEALSMAVSSVNAYETCPRLDVPVTPERVLEAVERLRRQHPETR